MNVQNYAWNAKTHTRTFQSDILHNMCAYFEWNKLYVAAHSWIWVWFNNFLQYISGFRPLSPCFLFGRSSQHLYYVDEFLVIETFSFWVNFLSIFWLKFWSIDWTREERKKKESHRMRGPIEWNSMINYCHPKTICHKMNTKQLLCVCDRCIFMHK